MKILIVTLLYYPDGGPSATLFKMLCEQLVSLKNEVTIIAAVPHYPTGQVSPDYSRVWIQRSNESGVEVVRIRVPSVDRKNLFLRLFQFICYQVGASLVALCQACDVALITNPAIEVFLPFFTLVGLRRKPSVFFVADVYPDVGIKLEIFRNHLSIAAITILERYCLTHARYIWAFSRSFIEPLEKLGVSVDRQEVIYSWIDTDFIRPLERTNSFSRQYTLDNYFVILYAGNIGLSQGWENIVKAAVILRNQPDIRFVFVGNGSALENLHEQVKQSHIENIQFIPFQPISRVPEVLATADIALLTLQQGIGSGSIPSKTFSYLASGRSVLAILDLDSDAADLVQRSNSGVVVPPEQPDAIAQTILALRDDPLRRATMSKAGRAYCVANHTPEKAAMKVNDLLIRAIEAT